MKNLLIIALVFVASFSANAQIETPQPSPLAKMSQEVGLTELTLEYSRPSMKGRTIFGDLVPYDKLWRTGANMNSKITFSDDVKIEGKDVKAGSYAIYTIPNKKSWDVMFYTDANNSGTPRTWDESKVAAKVTVDVMNMPIKMETYTMLFDDLTNTSAMLGIIWEDVYVGVKIEVPTDKKASENIAKVMNGPQAGDYYAAARYNLESNGDMKKAVEWIDKAIEMTGEKTPFWYTRQQALVHAKAGNTKMAIKAAKASLEAAEKAGNADYVKMNQDSIKAWEKM